MMEMCVDRMGYYYGLVGSLEKEVRAEFATHVWPAQESRTPDWYLLLTTQFEDAFHASETDLPLAIFHLRFGQKKEKSRSVPRNVYPDRATRIGDVTIEAYVIHKAD